MHPAIARSASAITVLGCFAAGAAAQSAPVSLSLADGGAVTGRSYTLTFVQDVALRGGEASIVREARLRFHFADGERVDDARSRASIVIDSARAATSSPHGREVIDARRLAGPPYAIGWSHRGGAVEWQPPVRSIDFGPFGGTLPIDALFDFAFPTVAGRAVRPGETWESTVARRSIDGNEWYEGDAAVRWTLDRIENVGGSSLAHVSFSMRRPGAREAGATGSFVIDARTGALLELSFEEKVPGTWDFGGEPLPFEQTTTLHIVADASHRSGPDEASGS